MVLFSLIVFFTLKKVRDGAAVHPAGWAPAQQASHPPLLCVATWPTSALSTVCQTPQETFAKSAMSEAEL